MTNGSNHAMTPLVTVESVRGCRLQTVVEPMASSEVESSTRWTDGPPFHRERKKDRSMRKFFRPDVAKCACRKHVTGCSNHKYVGNARPASCSSPVVLHLLVSL